jgi:hypothetical protein
MNLNPRRIFIQEANQKPGLNFVKSTRFKQGNFLETFIPMKSQGVKEDLKLPDYAELWQNTFEILSLGKICDPGLMAD